MKLGFGCLVNNVNVLRDNLLKSPIVGQLKMAINSFSAAEGLNKLIKNSAVDALALVHQDVFLPEGWEDRLVNIISSLGDDWGLLGVWGARIENGGFQSIGNIGDGRLGTKAVWYGDLPTDDVETVDEMCMIVNMNTGFLFDEKMIGWDLYGTYATLMMREMGRKVFVIDNPVFHNTHRSFDWRPDEGFLCGLEYLKTRFPNDIVISTSYHGEEYKRANPVFYGRA